MCWSSVICIYALLSCFIVEWAWFKLLMAGVVFHQSVIPQYKALQAERSLRRKKAERVMLLSLLEKDDDRLRDVCSVCMTPMEHLEARVTPCGHVFHVTCLTLWFDMRETCPLCQTAIVTEDATDNHVHDEQMMPEDLQLQIALPQ